MRTNSRPVAFATDLPSEVLPTPGGPTKAEDRTLQLLGALLHGEELDDPLFDLLQTVMVVVENGLASSRSDLTSDFSLHGMPSSQSR